jgi:hypothetical protein
VPALTPSASSTDARVTFHTLVPRTGTGSASDAVSYRGLDCWPDSRAQAPAILPTTTSHRLTSGASGCFAAVAPASFLRLEMLTNDARYVTASDASIDALDRCTRGALRSVRARSRDTRPGPDLDLENLAAAARTNECEVYTVVGLGVDYCYLQPLTSGGRVLIRCSAPEPIGSKRPEISAQADEVLLSPTMSHNPVLGVAVFVSGPHLKFQRFGRGCHMYTCSCPYLYITSLHNTWANTTPPYVHQQSY